MTISHAGWSDVEAAIRHLDGMAHTEVSIAAEADGPYMGIGGGPNRYFVSIWTSEERNLILTDPSQDESQIRLVVGGQAAAYPCRHTVAIEDAVEAAKIYFRTQSPDPGHVWADG